MTANAQEKHERETHVTAAELKRPEQIEVLKSKTTDVLCSPYVHGAVALGIAAAGYVLYSRKTTTRVTRASEPIDHPGDNMKVGSLLLPLVGLLATAINHGGVSDPSRSRKRRNTLRRIHQTANPMQRTWNPA